MYSIVRKTILSDPMDASNPATQPRLSLRGTSAAIHVSR